MRLKPIYKDAPNHDEDLLDMLREVVEAVTKPFESYDYVNTRQIQARDARNRVKEALIKLIENA